ncbi:DEAD/DEAH box helicase [Nocardioides caldifontis]|uniref:DEAD/DEAH box helicase n=1 Tax=Nocardioides caldifontis TaxID=2588938 RepID=UPI001EEFC6B4|nr:DEAD/DEAH box helicase [Nocardioides caldifontis]
MSFSTFDLPAPLVAALSAEGITTAFPIQSATLPHSLAGKDVLGRGRTGSGKTYAFLLPLVARLAASGTPRRPSRPRGLVLVPTRELATQVEAALRPLAGAMGLRVTTVFGGVPASRQVTALRQGVDVVVACPGRLNDLVRSGQADLGSVEVTVLDEADHMADLGFLPDVRRLLDATPRKGQRLLFSATLDAGVDVLVKRFLDAPVTHSVDSAQSPVTSMEHHVLHVDADGRLRVITDLAAAPGRTVVFTRTKHGAKQLARKLNANGVPAVELHGNLSQNARTRNLASFSSGAATTLVATDIAARGIHVDDVSLVIHADPPTEHKAYLHRSGRTARAGASGTVVTMMLDHQRADVRDLTRKAGIKPVVTRVGHDHPLLTTIAPGERTFQTPLVTTAATPSNGGGAGGQGRGRGRSRRGDGQGGSGQGRSGQGRSGQSRSGQSRSSQGGGQGGQPSGRSRQGGRRAAAPSGTSRPHSAAAFSGSVRSR